MTEILPKAHAKLSPSSSKRWMTCPGSIALIDSLDFKEKPSRFAAEGTVAHEIHELALKAKGKASKAIYYKGRTLTADGFQFKVSKDMVDAVQTSLDYIEDRIEEATLDGLRVELLVEVKSSLKYLDIPGLDGGTSDVVLLFWEGEELVEIEVFDYKHGAGVAVEVEDNTQALSYGLGIIQKYKALSDTKVRITISQPRAHHNDGRIRSWDIDADYIYRWQEEQLIPKAKATRSKDAKLVPSEDGCRFCPAAKSLACPAHNSRASEVAMIDFTDISDVNEPPKIVDVGNLTADQKIFIIKNASILRDFISAVENQMKLEVDHGSEEYKDHYKLVRKTTHRKFKEDSLDELSSPLLDYLDHSDIYEEKPRAMGEIERRLKKAVGKDDAKTIMGEITDKPEGELVIAPITDRRKAQEPSIISDFNNLA
jgi:hypothetical protein